MPNLFNTPPPETPVNTTVECAGRNYWIEDQKKIKEEIKVSSTLEVSKTSAHENE